MHKKLLIVLMLIVVVNVMAQENNKSAVVLELFTSQGCSSCPPADKLLDEIRDQYQDQNVFVLSYHVDYWNRLGWKDPFSKEAFSDYQRAYATQFNSRSIYTPQLVVNGNEHFTGSNRYKADDALKKYAKSKPSNTIILKDIKLQDSAVNIDYHVEGGKFNTITFALVVSERITQVARGENRNRKLKNTNIVVGRVVKHDDISQVSITIPNWISETDELLVIAYTQNESLKTTGATKTKI